MAAILSSSGVLGAADARGTILCGNLAFVAWAASIVLRNRVILLQGHFRCGKLFARCRKVNNGVHDFTS